jgi:cell wall-associated NlpC family hydrolase
MDTVLDKRLHAYRDDLANQGLRGRVDSAHFVTGEVANIKSHFADILDEPHQKAGLQTQILYGHEVTVFERKNGWAWIQRHGDGYVGYIREDVLQSGSAEATHMVLAPRTFLYPDTDLKQPRVGYRSMGSKLTVVGSATNRGTDYCLLDTGEAIIANHLIALGDRKDDYVSVAETLLHTPYLWGGDTGFGIDCSGLVFLAQMLCGKTVLRDSDMQAATLGEEIPFDEKALKRGDLIFWKGHVGIMRDEETLLHANGHTMNVALEPLHEAVARIGYLYGEPTMARRP